MVHFMKWKCALVLLWGLAEVTVIQVLFERPWQVVYGLQVAVNLQLLLNHQFYYSAFLYFNKGRNIQSWIFPSSSSWVDLGWTQCQPVSFMWGCRLLNGKHEVKFECLPLVALKPRVTCDVLEVWNRLRTILSCFGILSAVSPKRLLGSETLSRDSWKNCQDDKHKHVQSKVLVPFILVKAQIAHPSVKMLVSYGEREHFCFLVVFSRSFKMVSFHLTAEVSQ